MICHDLKFIYLHVPRTGGVSVEKCFNANIMDHSLPEDYLGYPNYFKAVFVRNPWDRLVSIYHNRLLNFGKSLPNFKKWLLRLDVETYQQTQWVLHEGDLFVDFIGRFETLKPDFEAMCQRVGVKKSLPHFNRSSHYHYSVYYDAESREWVKNSFAKEIEMFEYSFDLPDKMVTLL